MSSWMNEAAAVQNHNGNNPFPHMNDPNSIGGMPTMMDPSAFMANPGQFNPAAVGQYANPQQMAAAMQNGQMRNASPGGFQNPAYQTNSVVPSKRPRPREESMGASPRQNPGIPPTSRADTPQQSQFPGAFQQNAIGQQHPAQPQQYPHLQPNGSTNASPSPVMAGNQLRPGSVPQRVNTASPHPFSPASQQFAPQASPVPSEHGGTPQGNPYMQNQNFPQTFNPNYTPSPSPARPPSTQNSMAPQMMQQQMGQMPQQMQQLHPNQMAQMQQMQQLQQMQQAGRGMDPAQQQKMMYQMQLQRQLQQGNMAGNMPGNMAMAAQMQAAQAAQAQNMAGGRGMMPVKPGVSMTNGQMPSNGMNSQQPQIPRGTNPESFMKNLTTFMTVQNLPLDTNPIIEGRPLHLMQLFMMVSKFGFYRNVTQRNMWSQVSQAVGFNPVQYPSAPVQIRSIYERNLLKFEEAWKKQKGQGQPMGNAPSMPGQSGQPGQATPQRMGVPQGQMPHGQQPMQHGQQPQMQQNHAQSPTKQMTPGMPQVNGFANPQHPQMSQQPPSVAPGHMRNSLSRSVDATPVTGEFPIPSPSSAKAGSLSMQLPGQPDSQHANGQPGLPAPPASDPDEYKVCSREMNQDNYGGFDMKSIAKVGMELEQWRPDFPPAMELGFIDIHALTKSLQSGIHGEVRLALDTLGTVTFESAKNQNMIIDIRGCDDLVESLIDCAEEQVDVLAEGTKPISDEIDLTSYEDVMRQCRQEQRLLKKVFAFGDADYELDHAADRLIAITTILRNLSFYEGNVEFLADEVVVRFLCSTIRSLGTLETMLQSPKNTLDFMKDVVIFLSNIAGAIELPGKEQAFCLLQFLLAFAPSATPAMDGKILFSPYEPTIHAYLPHAVDSLAKLLARDEPNRTYYKAIFAVDATSSPPSDLLTRTFGLSICSIPDQNRENRPANVPSIIEARKPLLMQGLLAADVIASLAPSYESGVTRAWLSSGDGFAHNLYQLIRSLCQQAEPSPAPGRGSTRSQPKEDADLLHIITWGVSLLRRLCEKARDPNDPASIPPNALPTKDSLFTALQTLKSPKWAALLNQLSSYAGLES